MRSNNSEIHVILKNNIRANLDIVCYKAVLLCKSVFLKTSLNSQENTCVRVSF